MGFFKDYGMFQMATAKDQKDFMMGAFMHESGVAEEKQQTINEMIVIINSLNISEDKKLLAINLANRIKTSNKDSINNLLQEINRITGHNFK